MSEQREIKRTPGLELGGWPDDEYSADLAANRDRADARDTTEVTRALGRHEAPALRERLGKDADRVTVLQAGTRLTQGSTYVDLEQLDDGPFVAMAGQAVDEAELVAAKSHLDHGIWNALTLPPRQR